MLKEGWKSLELEQDFWRIFFGMFHFSLLQYTKIHLLKETASMHFENENSPSHNKRSFFDEISRFHINK